MVGDGLWSTVRVRRGRAAEGWRVEELVRDHLEGHVDQLQKELTEE